MKIFIRQMHAHAYEDRCLVDLTCQLNVNMFVNKPAQSPILGCINKGTINDLSQTQDKGVFQN